MRRYTDVQTRKDLSADINRERLAIGQRWFRLALAWSWSRSAPKTEAERQVAIRHLHPSHAVGAKAKNIGSLAASLDKVENLAAKIRQARVLRWRLTLPSGALYYNPTAPNAASQRPLAERLQLRIARLAEDTLLRTTSAPARDSVVVRTTTDPARLGLVVSFDLCCPYSGGYKSWTAKAYARFITVPHQWLSRVHKRGLDALGGMMTLDAAPVDTTERGLAVYAAAWLQQGRGYECQTVHGYIAVDLSGNSYHGKNVKAAIAGLRRKTATPAERHARSLAYIKGRMKKATQLCAGRTFTLADAKALGFCDYGIRSWCHRVGIDPDGQATIEQIIAGYKSAPVAEARQFILHYCR